MGPSLERKMQLSQKDKGQREGHLKSGKLKISKIADLGKFKVEESAEAV